MELTTKNTLIGAGLNLGGALVQQAFAGHNMQKQHEYSKDLLQYQWDNYHTSQVNALKKAGLNVGLMYSNGGPSVSGSTGSTTAPQIGNPMTGVGELLLSSQRAQADIENTKQHTEVLKQQVINDRLKQISIELDNIRKEKENNRFDKDAEARYNALLAEEKALLSQSRKNTAEAETEDATRGAKVGELESRTGLNNAQRDQIIELMPLEKDLKKSLSRLNDANASERYSQIGVNEVIKELKKADISKLKAEEQNIIIDTLNKQFHHWYEETYGHPLSSGMNSLIDWLHRRAAGVPHNGYDNGHRGAFGDIKELLSQAPDFILRDLKLTNDELNKLANEFRYWFQNFIN